MKFRGLTSLVLLVTLLAPSPAQAAPVYVFPVANCAVNYARAHHDYAATDILAKAGCKFVAPTDGVKARVVGMGDTVRLVVGVREREGRALMLPVTLGVRVEARVVGMGESVRVTEVQ